ncbi:hypothetical protein [Paracoccus thiocyanatus]|uniref:Uncharacterized protein n=1 Tax=Paracoccus thiocyanatus TaxID=34006 RepID=A0A3D8PFQ7_9RHOB|nr:hypothetical protein [Paracoccus thiocyanatus]RDW14101.1 hypothetical protein DIE28_04480 [Paracoccus thiocyanatus]
MAKLFSKTRILMPDGSEIAPRTVFAATPQQARQFDHLDAARAATAAEIEAAEDARAKADGLA